ncbi:MAG: hypothetical protein JXR71_03525 [Bacteroidales bacterium]|nr:hypothetical protein [Bacteroidales bacterium]
MKIALIQQKAEPHKPKNLEKGLLAVDRAAEAGAQLIVFAELAFEPFYPQFPAGAEKEQLAETLDGPIIKSLQEKAIKHNVVIIPNFFERSGNQTFDSSPVINTDGTIMGITRMVHVPDYEYFHEKTYYTPGDQGIRIYETPYGKIGIAICYDRHYPEYMRALGVAGAELVVVPQAGAAGEWTDGLYESELQIAAFQNGYFVALCNRVGVEQNLNFSGESFVCGPDGRLLKQAGKHTDELLLCDIDLSETKTSHARKLFYPDRRKELYRGWLD